MTTGSTSFSNVIKTVDGWPFYHYGNKSWTGGDVLPGSRPKTKVTRKYTFVRYVKNAAGVKLPTQFEALRTRLVPSALRNPPPHEYTTWGKEFKQDDFKVGVPGGVSHNGGLINELPFETLWDSSDDVAIVSKLRERIAGSDFNVAVTSAEMHKTMAMLADNAKRMRLFYSNFRKGNFPRAVDELFGGRKLKRPSKRAGRNWLELQYGWKPLLQDVHSGAQFAAHTLNSPRVFRVEATRGALGLSSSSRDYPYWGLGSDGDVMINVRHQESKKLIAFLTEVNVPQLAGLEDPASVVYELVPLSWLVDWFIPIGSWLSARSLSQSLTGTYILCYRKRTRYNYSWLRLNSGAPSGMVFLKRPSSAEYSEFFFSRRLFTSLPVPVRPQAKPLAKIPSFAKAITSLALLAGIRR